MQIRTCLSPAALTSPLLLVAITRTSRRELSPPFDALHKATSNLVALRLPVIAQFALSTFTAQRSDSIVVRVPFTDVRNETS